MRLQVTDLGEAIQEATAPAVVQAIKESITRNCTNLAVGSQVSLDCEESHTGESQPLTVEEFLTKYSYAVLPAVVPAQGESRAEGKCSVARAVTTKVWLRMLREKGDHVIHVHGMTNSNIDMISDTIIEQAVALSNRVLSRSERVHADLLRAHLLLNILGSATKHSGFKSRRFGCFTQLQFDANGALTGAKLCDFHLEASRLVLVPRGESNFHIFHAMCDISGSLPEWKYLKLSGDSSRYAMLSGTAKAAAGDGGIIAFESACKCMRALGMKKRFQHQFFAVLAGLLHLSNIEFGSSIENKQGAASIKNVEILNIVSELLGVSASTLEASLTCKTSIVGDSAYTDFLTPSKAERMRDDLMCAMYSCVFTYIVDIINKRLNRERDFVNFIGVFHMGGIENNHVNGMHELCKNYAMERIYSMQLNGVVHEHHSLAAQLQRSVTIPQTRISDEVTSEIVCAIERETRIRKSSKLTTESPSATSNQNTINDVLDVLNVEFSQHPGVLLSENPAHEFAIEHSLATVSYSIHPILHQMSGLVYHEFITMFRKNGTRNLVLAQAFSEARITSYLSTKRSATLVGARVNVSRSITKKSKADEEKESGGYSGSSNEGDRDRVDWAMPLSRISSTSFGQHRNATLDLLSSLSTCRLWTVLVIPGCLISEQVVSRLFLPEILSMHGTLPYQFILTASDLQERYPACAEMSVRDSSSEIKGNPVEPRSQLSDFCSALGLEMKFTEDKRLALTERDWLRLEAAEVSSSLRDQFSDEHPPSFRSVQEQSPPTGDMSDSQSIASGGFPQDPEEHFESSDERKVHERVVESRAQIPISVARRRWIFLTNVLTFWIPNAALRWYGMKRDDIMQSWREKVALCMLIAFLSALMVFFITGFGKILCPTVSIFTTEEFQAQQRSGSAKWLGFQINGGIYDFTRWSHPAVAGFDQQKYLKARGLDLSPYFPRWDPATGAGPTACNKGLPFVYTNMTSDECAPRSTSTLNMTGYCHSFQNMIEDMLLQPLQFPVYKVGQIAWSSSTVALHNTDASKFVIADTKVYDVTQLVGPNSPLSRAEIDLLNGNAGNDITKYATPYLNMKCLDAVAAVGVVDDRNYAVCQIGTYILLTVTYIMVAVMVIKFLSALQLGSKRIPEDMDKFIILQVPCYSEGRESLKKTIDSLSLTTYDDTRKLLFVVADGMIRGSGNEKSTPDIVLDIFGVPENLRSAHAFSYHAVGEGSKSHNKAKVYSGLYHIQGRAVPYMFVVKTGTDRETARAGNRGKRDSQMILMKFLNKVFFTSPMVPLELEIYRHIRNEIGVQPSLFEYVLMVDADTEVGPECLTRLISACMNDSKIMGLCGETRIANEDQSWVTMIQVYEYYISHHLAKAFESLFGSVTCLPGCFCMYRVFSNLGGKRTLLLVDENIIQNYSECIVDTLHKKNLLSLGEDRYLTTLMLKNFNDFKMKFTPDSHCFTIVPDKFSVLLSQRRRWINSTIHNLFELATVKNLCGCLIFSMRFVVILDLFATLVMPASVAYMGYIIYMVTQDSSGHLQVLILIGITYGLQAAIFLLKRQWQHIGWMIIHVLAMPVFYMYIPLYSFWHFDDFSWGSTRRVHGDAGASGHDGDDDYFDPASIPTALWENYKRVKRAEASLDTTKTVELSSVRSIPSRSGLRNAPLMDPAQSASSKDVQLPPQSSTSNILVGRNISVNSLHDMYKNTVYQTGGVAAGIGLSPSMHNLFTCSAASSSPGSTGVPSDFSLMEMIREIMLTGDLTTLTKKDVRKQLSIHFQTDLSTRKDFINSCVETILSELD